MITENIEECTHTIPLNDATTLSNLCYPDRAGCSGILASLSGSGIDRLCYAPGRGQYPGVIGKGHSSIVALALYRGSPVAVKIRRTDSKRESLRLEGRRLLQASVHGATPRPYYFDDNVIVMEYVRGPHLVEYIDVDPVYAVEEALLAARALDCAYILHEELNRPWRHVRFTSVRGKALILDLDSAHRGCGNVVKLVSGLLSRFHGGVSFLRGMRELLREYSNGCSYDLYYLIFDKIMDFLRGLYAG
ncbi:MAG: hypothetical protein GSR73_02595 [Desulfurococcales archaeon]|nr:hypothetical protein [Desulfurococcales archaeon]